ncbi:MAG TPA: MFS transporter, partial [Acidimicrobiales bacterium]|nr:MFS transporter [Acidimicrobiales bacterium]
MPKVVTTHLVEPDEVERYLTPRTDLLVERPAGPRAFTLETGPFHRYERDVELSERGDQVAVTETIHYRLAVPVWGFLFELPLRRALRQPRAPSDAAPRAHRWWAPPDHLDARAAVGLSLLCLFSVLAGYLGTLLSQTNTYFKQDFGVSDGAVGVMLAATRVGALLALAIVALADRRGRRWVLILAAVAGCALTATGALCPSLAWLGVSQTLARSFSTALTLVISIIAVEEMPAGSRAFAVSVLTATAALGAGMAVMLLKVADLGIGAWRVLYVVPLPAIPLVLFLGRRIPETERFARQQHAAPRLRWREQLAAMDRGRLALLSGAGFLLALFVLPASSFLNEFLRTDRGFSASGIIAFQILTSTPGGIGIVVGGRLADKRGRRLVGSLGVGLGSGFTVLMFLTAGPAMWGWSLVGTVAGAMAVPALAVYGPELFPTHARGLANGLINLFTVLGSATGLALAGWLADRTSGLGTAMAILAVGPALVVGLILMLFPETASVELEELNPTDASLAAAAFASGLGDAPFGRELLEFDGLTTEAGD